MPAKTAGDSFEDSVFSNSLLAYKPNSWDRIGKLRGKNGDTALR